MQPRSPAVHRLAATTTMLPRLFLLPLLCLFTLAAHPASATFFLASSTADIPLASFDKLLQICQAVNAQATVVALNTAAKRSAAAALMTGDDGKVYVSATYDTAATPPDYYWVDTQLGTTTRTVVSSADFAGGTAPTDQLTYVLYSNDPFATGLIPFPGVTDYKVLCSTNDPTYTTLPPTTTTASPSGGGGGGATTTTTATPSDKTKGGGFPWWAILIIVLGVVVLLVVVAVVVCCCCFECVSEEELAEEAEGDVSDSPQFRSRETRSFTHSSHSASQSASTDKGHPRGTVSDGSSSSSSSSSGQSGTSSRSGSATTSTSSAFSGSDTSSTYSHKEASVTHSHDGRDPEERRGR